MLNILNTEKLKRLRAGVDSEEDWYSYLYEKMISGFYDKAFFQKFQENKISFITFNYDRSLDYFFYDSLLHTFDPEDKGNIIKSIPPICHIYGQVAPLPWENEDEGVEYRADYTFETLNNLKNNIKLVYDVKRDRDSEFMMKEIYGRISGAQKIFFLGFGYAEENLDILNICDLLKLGQKVYGSAYKLYPNERGKIKKDLEPKFESKQEAEKRNVKPSIILENCSSYALLRKYIDDT